MTLSRLGLKDPSSPRIVPELLSLLVPSPRNTVPVISRQSC